MRMRPPGTYTDQEIQFIIDSLTAWSVARHDNRYSPRLYDLSQLFHPALTVEAIREHLNSAGIANAIASVATSQWIAHAADDPEASIARTFVYEPYLQGEAAALVDEREAQ